MLVSFPNEIIFNIASELPQLDRLSLAQTCTNLYSLLSNTIIHIKESRKFELSFQEFVQKYDAVLDSWRSNFDMFRNTEYKTLYQTRETYSYWEDQVREYLKGLRGCPKLTYDEVREERSVFLAEAKLVENYIRKMDDSTVNKVPGYNIRNMSRLLRKIAAKDVISPIEDDKKCDGFIKNFSFNQFKVLIEAGADINDYSINGNTALHWAIQRNNIQLVSWIGGLRPDLTMQNAQGNTALHLAANSGYEMVCKVLDMSYHIHLFINIQNKQGKTALHLAAERKDEKSVEKLIKNRADKGIKDKQGNAYDVYLS